jgi:hypothetical protein
VRANQLIKVFAQSMVLDTGGASVPELIFALRAVRPERVLGLRLPTYPAMIDGVSYLVAAEPATSALFRAVRADTLTDWARQHPEWVNRI